MYVRERIEGEETLGRTGEMVKVNNLSLRPFFRSSSASLRAKESSLFSPLITGFFLLSRVLYLVSGMRNFIRDNQEGTRS